MPRILYAVKRPSEWSDIRGDLQRIKLARRQGLSARDALRPKYSPGCRPVYFSVTVEDLRTDRTGELSQGFRDWYQAQWDSQVKAMQLPHGLFTDRDV